MGSGIAGLCAALSSAVSGQDVVIIEKSSSLGGNLVRSNVGTICGSYLRSESELPKLVGNEFTQSLITEILNELNIESPINYHKGLHVIPYDWKEIKAFFEKKISAHPSIQIMLGTSVIGFEKELNSIAKVITSNRGEFSCDSVVDCSGISSVTRTLNHQIIKADNYQAASQVFRISQVEKLDEAALNLAIKKFLIQSSSLNPNSISVVPGSIRNNSIDLKVNLPDLIDETLDVEQLTKSANSLIHSVFNEMKKEIDCFVDSQIVTIFPDVGVRVFSRPKGKAILSKSNVLNCDKPKDGVAIGSWPIEYWNPKGELEMSFFSENEYYLISANSLISDELDNLFFAGKNISASEEGIASARVIGTCIQTGYAAGKLASAFSDLESKIISELRNELKIGDEHI